jgi:hypothetical protein
MTIWTIVGDALRRTVCPLVSHKPTQGVCSFDDTGEKLKAED